MNSQIRAYKRVASKYKWDYQGAELELAENLKELTRLSRICNHLSSELDELLQVDSQSSHRVSINPERSDSLFMLATSLNDKLAGYRLAYQQQTSRVVNLRKQLLQARTRRDKSRDKYQAAITAFHKQLEAKESNEIADLFAGRRHSRALIASGNLP